MQLIVSKPEVYIWGVYRQAHGMRRGLAAALVSRQGS